MLEYVKTILGKVSFDEALFEKELRKGLKVIAAEERQPFRQWCYETFSDLHQETLGKVFCRGCLVTGKTLSLRPCGQGLRESL